MSIEVGRILVEIAASHLFPALVGEVSGHLVRRTVGDAILSVSHPKARSRQLRLLRPLSSGVDVTVASDIPGRVRFNVPDLREAPALSCEAETILLRLPGVRKAKINHTTGSVLVEYELGQTTALRIRTALELPPGRRTRRGRQNAKPAKLTLVAS